MSVQAVDIAWGTDSDGARHLTDDQADKLCSSLQQRKGESSL